MYGFHHTAAGIVTGTWFDGGTVHGNFIIIRSGAEAEVTFYKNTDNDQGTIDPTPEVVTFTSNIGSASAANCKYSTWEETKNDQRWSGEFPDDFYDDGETAYYININGQLSGTYTYQGNPFGVIVATVDSTGLEASGMWYEANWLEAAYGRVDLYLPVDGVDAGKLSGYWAYEDEEPIEDDPEFEWSTPATITDHFTNEDVAWTTELMATNNVIGPAEWYCVMEGATGENRRVNYPWKFCETETGYLTSSFYGDMGYFEGEYFEGSTVGAGLFGQTDYVDMYYGAFLYIATKNWGLKGWYILFDDPTDDDIAGQLDADPTLYYADGPYAINGDADPPGSTCEDNYFDLPVYPPLIPPDEPADMGAKVTCGLILAVVLCFLF